MSKITIQDVRYESDLAIGTVYTLADHPALRPGMSYYLRTDEGCVSLGPEEIGKCFPVNIENDFPVEATYDVDVFMRRA